MSQQVYTGRTAVHRGGPSALCLLLESEGAFVGKQSILDYGCGYGDDVSYLREIYPHKMIVGYDPHHHNEAPLGQLFDLVICSNVLDVLPPEERHVPVRGSLSFLKPRTGVAYFGTKGPGEEVSGYPHKDGVLTRRQTFEKVFSMDELCVWTQGRAYARRPGLVVSTTRRFEFDYSLIPDLTQ